MEITKNEIERLFPSVYVTLMSMLLGFAVEDVITQLRELNSIDVYSALIAVGILSAIFACWTGWSFVSLTQERLASVLDGLNVFSLTFCMYVLSSTIGQDIWWFFAGVSIYFVVAQFAFFYNTKHWMKALNALDRKDLLRWPIVLIVHPIPIYIIAAWMSAKGALAPSIELYLIIHYILIQVVWTYFMSRAWFYLTKDLN